MLPAVPRLARAALGAHPATRAEHRALATLARGPAQRRRDAQGHREGGDGLPAKTAQAVAAAVGLRHGSRFIGSRPPRAAAEVSAAGLAPDGQPSRSSICGWAPPVTWSRTNVRVPPTSSGWVSGLPARPMRVAVSSTALVTSPTRSHCQRACRWWWTAAAGRRTRARRSRARGPPRRRRRASASAPGPHRASGRGRPARRRVLRGRGRSRRPARRRRRDRRPGCGAASSIARNSWWRVRGSVTTASPTPNRSAIAGQLPGQLGRYRPGPERAAVGAAAVDRGDEPGVDVDVDVQRRLDRREVVRPGGVGQPADAGAPSGVGQRDQQVVQRRAAAHDLVAAVGVGARQPPRRVGVEVDAARPDPPAPRLAVVHRRGADRPESASSSSLPSNPVTLSVRSIAAPPPSGPAAPAQRHCTAGAPPRDTAG